MINIQINFYNEISIIISLEINILDVTKLLLFFFPMKIHHCKSLWASEILTSNLFFLFPISYPDTFHTVSQSFFIEISRALKPVACSYLSHPFTLTYQHGFKDNYFKVLISIVLAQQPNPEECLHIKKAAGEKKQNTGLLTRLTQNSWLQFSAAYSTVYHSVTYWLRLETLLILGLPDQLLYHIFISKWGW